MAPPREHPRRVRSIRLILLSPLCFVHGLVLSSIHSPEWKHIADIVARNYNPNQRIRGTVLSESGEIYGPGRERNEAKRWTDPFCINCSKPGDEEELVEVPGVLYKERVKADFEYTSVAIDCPACINKDKDAIPYRFVTSPDLLKQVIESVDGWRSKIKKKKRAGGALGPQGILNADIWLTKHTPGNPKTAVPVVAANDCQELTKKVYQHYAKNHPAVAIRAS